MPTRKYLRTPRHFIGRIAQTDRLALADLETLYDLDLGERRLRKTAPKRPHRNRRGWGDER